MKKQTKWYIFTDGASRGNPGNAGAGIYAVDEDNKVILQEGFYLSKKTNNQAEYLALVFAAFLLAEKVKHRADHDIHLAFMADSELLVKQMRGEYKAKNKTLAQLKHNIETFLTGISHSFTHVFREDNKNADALANSGIDKKKKLPPELAHFLIENPLFSLTP